MRTIKFRAWDKEQGKMFRDAESASLGKMLAINAFGQPFFYQLGSAPFSHFSGEHLIIQMFTGLLDKNGKEIYEGDIIGGDKLRRFEIIWKDGIGDFQQEAGWWMLTGDEVFALHQGRVGKYKVLGNIYENGDLLKC